MATRELETLAFGFGLIEGPRVDAEGVLYFSDVPNGGVRALAPDGEITVVIPKRRGVGGSDRRDLYIVTADNTDDPDRAGSIFRTRVDTPGVPVPLARV